MNLTAVDITTSSVLLNWTEPNGQISRCHVEYEDNNLIAENTSIMWLREQLIRFHCIPVRALIVFLIRMTPQPQTIS